MSDFPASMIFGVLSAVLQIAGYILYIRQFLGQSIRPNAASWFMFAYGTALLVALEWNSGGEWPVLALPTACAVMSILVAILCLRKNATDPIENSEKIVFSADVALTIAFVGASLGLFLQSVPKPIFLILGNITTFTAFMPILISTWSSPHRETPTPWLVWTSAYGCLFIATIWQDRGAHPELIIYPTLSALLHGAVAYLSLMKLKSERIMVGAGNEIYIDASGIEGRGMFAAAGFGRGDAICTLRGEPRYGPVRSDVGPNWIGTGRDSWIDPELPLDHINHSCDANAAFGENFALFALREIAPDEEITLDYSTTEADPDWEMACACGTESCRGTLKAIQVTFAETLFPPPAAPVFQMLWRELRPASGAEQRPAFPQMSGTEYRAKAELVPIQQANEG